MLTPLEEIEKALDILVLPKLISRAEVKKQYHFLAKKNHPDIGGSSENMEALNHAYKLLITYMEEFRYAFDSDEVSKQFPGADYVDRFRP